MSDLIPHVVQQGEFLTQLAVRHGFDADAVWNHASNKGLKAKRADPNMLAPMDVLYYPKADRKFLPVKIGQPNAFKAKVVTVSISLRFTDVNGPMKGAPYSVEGAELPPGNLTSEGVFKADIPSGISQFILVLPNRRHVVRVGHLDPINTLSGVLQRLAHLGYLSADVTRMEADFHHGLSRFRAHAKIVAVRKHGEGIDKRFEDVQRCDQVGTLTTEALEALLSAHGS